jgi:hypothetical protein
MNRTVVKWLSALLACGAASRAPASPIARPARSPPTSAERLPIRCCLLPGPTRSRDRALTHCQASVSGRCPGGLRRPAIAASTNQNAAAAYAAPPRASTGTRRIGRPAAVAESCCRVGGIFRHRLVRDRLPGAREPGRGLSISTRSSSGFGAQLIAPKSIVMLMPTPRATSPAMCLYLSVPDSRPGSASASPGSSVTQGCEWLRTVSKDRAGPRA